MMDGVQSVELVHQVVALCGESPICGARAQSRCTVVPPGCC